MYGDISTMSKKNDLGSLLSCYSTNKANFSNLVRLMRRRVVIPFIGAGISINFGYSSWNKFISEQAEKQSIPEIKTMLKQKEYEKAASLLKQKLSGDVWEHILLQNFGDHIYKASDSSSEFELIPQLFRSLILTTNFDEVIEMLYAKVNGEYIEKLTPKSLRDNKVIYKRIACGDPTLIKLHGDVATREFILTEQEYNDTYGEYIVNMRLPLPAFLRDILLSKVILFIGCSLEDDRTLKVIEQAQIDGGMSFALLPLPRKTKNPDNPWEPKLFNDKNNEQIEKKSFTKRKQFLNQHNIIPIWYPCDMGEQCVKIFLRELACEVDSEFRMSATNVKEKVKQLIETGKNEKKRNNILQAYQVYESAENLIKANLWAFSKKEQIDWLKIIKEFYNDNGFGYEKREIFRDLINLIKQSNYGNGLELAKCYQDMGYMFEKYYYYKLMLKAMRHSVKILEDCKERFSQKDFNLWLDQAAYSYTSLGYAYLKNRKEEDSKKWYEKASALLDSGDFKISSKAFINNGLYRYYRSQKNTDKALECLDLALEQRKGLVHDEYRDLPQHIVNTYSNIIRIYLNDLKDTDKALKEYNLCIQEEYIKNKLSVFPDAKRRIITDHGDILSAMGKYDEAFKEYKKALSYRKYLHFIDDLIVADLYMKMSNCLEHLLDRRDEALEYIIQSYVIYQKASGDNEKLMEISKQMHDLNKKLGYKESALEKRLEAQGCFLDYRYDGRMKEREEQLIQYFELD